jgi:hypothetical protein
MFNNKFCVLWLHGIERRRAGEVRPPYVQILVLTASVTKALESRFKPAPKGRLTFTAVCCTPLTMAANKRILNVDNGPGSNGLRGGIKQYSAKTTTGPWMDTYKGPSGYKRGFTSSDFQTEAQHAQLGAIGKPRGEFGAEIPFADTRDDKGNEHGASGTETWMSNTKATHPNFGVVRKVDDISYICGCTC